MLAIFSFDMIIVGMIGVGIVLLSGFFLVAQQTVAIVERFGKFNRVYSAGLNWRWPLMDRIAGRMSLRLGQLDVEIETKTFDNVFVHLLTSVQFKILEDNTYAAFYMMEDPEKQIQAFVFDVVRARVPQIKLDDVFSRKDEIAQSVKQELQEEMNALGYTFVKTLVTDIRPDLKVKSAMNEINEAQRLRVAAMERGEAEKILRVKQAEAEAESKILQGRGIAGERKAIIEGFQSSLESFKKGVPETCSTEIMNLILVTQYLDTLREIGKQSGSQAVFLPHSPGYVNDIQNAVTQSLLGADHISKKAPQTPLSD